jgi:hypothetical protein
VGVVAPASLKAWGWPVAATLAAGSIGLLAFHGERPEPGLARFTPAGLLADWPVEQVTSVEVSSPAYWRSFRRSPGGGWHPEGADAAITPELAERIEMGLTLLHNSGPQRSDLANAQLEEFGLAPPSLTITARRTDGAGITIEFGGANSLGLERYARVIGRAEILLMPTFVAAAWEPLAAAR